MAEGIENWKELLVGTAELSSGLSSIAEDGISVGDVQHLPKVISSIRHLTSIDLAKLAPEAKDFDDAEKTELAGIFAEKFDITGDSVEDIIEKGIPVALEVLQAVLVLININPKKK